MEEIWKDIKGYEGWYQVSNLGRVKSLIRKNVLEEKIIKGGIQKNGYKFVLLCKDKNQKFLELIDLLHKLLFQTQTDIKKLITLMKIKLTIMLKI